MAPTLSQKLAHERFSVKNQYNRLGRRCTERSNPWGKDDPSYSQTREDITEYYRNAFVEDWAAYRTTYGGFLKFTITEIDSNKGGRVYLVDYPRGWGGPAFYIKSGKNCQSPTGQASLVVPTDEIFKFVREWPRGFNAMVKETREREIAHLESCRKLDCDYCRYLLEAE